MRVLVTGGTGVVGAPAVLALVAAGHEVTAVARSADKEQVVRAMGAAPVRVDLFDADAVRSGVAGHEAVVHLATSIPSMTQAVRSSAWAANERLRSEASHLLVDAVLATGATRYVQESIGLPYLDHADAWIDEGAPVDHVGIFRGAGAAEAAATRVTTAGANGVVLRFAQLHGPASSHVAGQNALARRRINPFVGPADAYSSFVHADDAGAAVAVALGLPAGIYNVVDDEPLTRADAGRAVAAALGVEAPRAVPASARAAMPATVKQLTRSLRISNRKLQQAGGWAPAHPSIRGSWSTVTDAEVGS